MTTGKQKVIGKNNEVEKRLAAVEVVRTTRRKIAQVHKSLFEIDSLIREVREGTRADYK